jgi:hypothetical protein
MSDINLQDTTIENEVIAIRDTTSFNVIGKDAILKNCELQIAVPSRALAVAETIVGGMIHAKRELHGFDWLDARLDGVTFKGRFKNNRFGNFPPMYDDGTIANCDFSKAKLRDALFLNTNCDGVTFGPWPKFTVTNSPEFHASIERCAESNPIWDYFHFLSDYINEYSDDSVTLNFMTIDAEDLCKRENFDIGSFRNCVGSVAGVVH